MHESSHIRCISSMWLNYSTHVTRKRRTSLLVIFMKPRAMICFLLFFWSTILLNVVAGYDICFDQELKQYKACSPPIYDIINNPQTAVTVSPPEATCGTPAADFRRIGDDGNFKCDTADPTNSHPPNHIVDGDKATWWQSTPLVSGQRDHLVTVSLAFGKMFRLTGNVVITFHSARPEVMVLERSVDLGQTWIPLQYFARFCTEFQGAPNLSPSFDADNPTAVTCTTSGVETSSRIRSGRRVTYDLDERFALFWGPAGTDLPNVYTNLQTKMLPDLLFTNLRIRLIRPYRDTSSDFDKFFYAMQSMNVAGRCFCNLHAHSCSNTNGIIQCVCEHNAEGTNCERCKPLYNERPWQSGSYIPYPNGTANECVKCECNDHAESCTYNATYRRGICDTCLHNTQGYHCQDCVDGFYPNVSRNVNDVDRCADCNCHPLGVANNNNVCNRDLNSNIPLGQCVCKPQVTNLRCDRCVNGYYGLMMAPQGECKACQCNTDGTMGQSNTCAEEDGKCPCKTSTTGRQCDTCADTYYNFPTGNPNGECTACECNRGGSLSQVCNKQTGKCECKTGISGDKCENSATGKFAPVADNLVFQPASGDCPVTSDRWTAAKPFDGSGFALCDLLGKSASVTFEEITGGLVQLALSWPYFVAIRYTNISPHTITGTITLTVKGSTTKSLSPLSERLKTAISPGCPLTTGAKTGEVKLSFSPGQSTASMSSDIKFDVDARCSYSLQLSLDSIQTNTRRRRAAVPENGLLVDSVALFPSLSSKDGTQKLEALKDSKDEAATKQSYETCLQGVAILSTRDKTLAEAQCKELLFTVSSDIYNSASDCDCDANGANNPSQCSSVGGQCNCKFGVGGRKCDICLPGYFNFTANGCEACDCYDPGSTTGSCNVNSGQCPCKANILTLEGLAAGASEQDTTATRTCRRCVLNFFGLDSGNGCSVCECNADGSSSLQCDDKGQCPCKDTTQGLKCDSCKDSFYSFGPDGCRACACNEAGSTSGNCNQATGKCDCKTNALGDKCDQCKTGHFNLASYNPDGCQPCFCFGHSTTCTSASGFQLNMIQAAVPSNSDSLHGRRYMSYGRTLSFSMAASFILDISGETLVTIEGINGDKIFHQAQSGSVLPKDQQLKYEVHLFENYWLFQTVNGAVKPTPVQMYRTLADISKVTFIENSKGQEIRVSLIILEIAEANETTTVPVQFVESCTCQADKKVQGLSCEQCSVGFKRPDAQIASSYQSCVACNCNSRSVTTPPECNEVTGVCLNCRNGTTGDNCENCAPFVTGADCDTCQSKYWGLSETGCKACECSSPGSKSDICNQESGQCDCADNVVGRTCDKCDENFHSLTSAGCAECDACYSLLKVEVAELRSARDFLVANVSEIETRDKAFGDLEPFVERFRKANEETAKLISFLNSARDAEADVVSNITSLNISLSAIQPHLTTIEDSNLSEIEDRLSQVEVFIAKANEQRQQLVVSATKANTDIGDLGTSSATLKNLADDLQKVLTTLETLANASSADRQLLEELNHLNTTAHMANKEASILLKRVQEANEYQLNTTSRLIRLESEIISLMAKVTKTHTTAAGLATSSQETTRVAAILQANLEMIKAFTIDFSNLKTKTDNAKSRTDSLETEVTNQRTTFDTQNTQFKATTEISTDLADKTNTVGSSAAKLIARANKAEQRMMNIEKDVNNIFESAESTRDILANFKSKADAIEAKANEALAQVSPVHETSLKLINESQELSKSLTALQKISSDTHQASQQALQAVQPKLSQIKVVSNEAATLENTLDKTESGYEQRASIINSASKDIIEPVNKTCHDIKASHINFQTELAAAAVSADNAQSITSTTIIRANEILSELRSLQTVDGATAEKLLEDVKKAEEILNADDLKVIVNGLLAAKETQKADIEQLTKQKDTLKAKIQRLQSMLQQIRPANNG